MPAFLNLCSKVIQVNRPPREMAMKARLTRSQPFSVGVALWVIDLRPLESLELSRLRRYTHFKIF